MPSFENDFEYLCHIYRNGGTLPKMYINNIFYAAGYFLSNAKIYKNLDNAQLAIEQIDQLSKMRNEKVVEARMAFHMILSNYYQHTVDDVLIVSAFENYAKGMLLKRRYIPHVVNSPIDWKREQKKQPLHILKFRAGLARGIDIQLSDMTLSPSILTKNSYLDKIEYSKQRKAELLKTISNRNKLHFRGMDSYSFKSEYFDQIAYLTKLIKKQMPKKYPTHLR